MYRFFKNNKYRFIVLASHGFFDWMNDERYLKLKYRVMLGKELNLDNPKSFNEKLQWLKLNDHNPMYTNMVDKYEVKKIISSIIGSEHIVPTLGAWDRFDDIDFSTFPNQFVLKCTHDSGGLIICKDKSCFNKKQAKKKIEKCLKRNYYYLWREWPYKNVTPRIIAEPYLSGLDNKELVEYKFFCFNGTVKMILVCEGDAHGTSGGPQRTNTWLDRDFKKLPFMSLNPTSVKTPVMPPEINDAIALAEKLSNSIPHVRVDTYILNGNVYVGEMTFYHNSGGVGFEPEEWDYRIGEWLELPEVQQ